MRMSVEETRERVLLIGKCFLGYRESNNNSNKFGDWYGIFLYEYHYPKTVR